MCPEADIRLAWRNWWGKLEFRGEIVEGGQSSLRVVLIVFETGQPHRKGILGVVGVGSLANGRLMAMTPPLRTASPRNLSVDPIDGLLPIPRHHQWSASSDAHISAPFLDESPHPTPTCRSREPKRPKTHVSATPATDGGPQHRRKGTPCSPQRRGGRSGDSPHGYIEPIARSDSPKSHRHHLKPSALSTIDLASPRIPSFPPIPNRETLKELDLEAVLCNPQLRE